MTSTPAASAPGVVGRATDARDRGPRQPVEPEVYLAVQQGPPGVFEWIGRQVVLCVRPAPGVPVTAADLRHAVQDAAPEAPLFDVQTLEARFAGHLARERRLAALLVPPEQPASASPRWGCWL